MSIKPTQIIKHCRVSLFTAVPIGEVLSHIRGVRLKSDSTSMETTDIPLDNMMKILTLFRRTNVIESILSIPSIKQTRNCNRGPATAVD